MDKTALLMEMNEILGYKETAKKMEAATPTPATIASRFQQPGNTLVDDAVLESLARLEWSQVFQLAAFGMYPPDVVIGLNRALSEGTSAFRAAWGQFAESYEIPEGMGRGTFLLLHKVSPDDGIMTRVVSWASKLVDEADSRVKTKLEKESPSLAEAMFSPAGNAKKQERETADTEKYMTPYPAGTPGPDAKKKILTPRMFQDPKKVVATQKKDLKGVQMELDKLTRLAKKAGSTPEEMFPLLWRDLNRERVRHS